MPIAFKFETVDSTIFPSGAGARDASREPCAVFSAGASAMLEPDAKTSYAEVAHSSPQYGLVREIAGGPCSAQKNDEIHSSG